MKKLKSLFEKSAFGVCQYLGDKLGIAAGTVRMHFIYITFITMGSPLIIYLFMAFWLNIKRYIRRNTMMWD
jgi:phage shock protein PspC (stress-responsive transcriptional regulator)